MVASENFPASLAKFYAYRLTAIILLFSLYSSFSEITIRDAENFITTKLNEFPYFSRVKYDLSLFSSNSASNLWLLCKRMIRLDWTKKKDGWNLTRSQVLSWKIKLFKKKKISFVDLNYFTVRSFAVVSRRQRNNEKEKKKNFRTLVASFPPPSLSHMRGRRVDVGVIRWRRRLACCGGWRKVAGDWIRKTVLQFLLHNAVPDVKENTDLRWEPREETSRDISNIFSQRKRPDEWLRKKIFFN